MGVMALLALAGIRPQEELFEKTETYRTFRHPRHQAVRRRAAHAETGCEILLSLQIPPKISTAWRASSGRATQGAGFHATFSFAAALCDAVWPN
jgi:hypothetical protein